MPEVIALATLAAVFQKQVKNLRKPILNAAAQFGVVREKLKDLAPKVIGLFNKVKGEHPALTFIDFVRMIDPSVPTQADDTPAGKGYRNHKTYYTMRYMQTSLTQRPRGRSGTREAATDDLARSLKTVLQIVKNPDAIWKAVAQELGLESRSLVRLQKRVEATKAFIDLTGSVKPVNVTMAKIIHMEPAKVQPQSATANLATMRGKLADMTKPGQRVKIPA